jgi:SPP1 gp7 family putative phage head morphogenesis protein
VAHLHATGSYSPENLPQKPYQALTSATYKVLTQAVNYSIEDGKVPMVMQQALRENLFVFSGLKTHAQIKEASQWLLDEQGNRTPFNTFAQKVLSIHQTYNKHYLEAEYLFAQQSGQMAAKWVADTGGGNAGNYYLQYRTASDDKVRDSHRALHDTTLPHTDAFWDSYYPPNGWRCRCTVVRVLKTDYTPSDSPAAIAAGNTATTNIGADGQNKLAMFRFNPGKQQKIIPDGHPYEKVKGAAQAKKVLNEIKSFEVVQQFDNGGKVLVHGLVNKNATDYKAVLECCMHFAKLGKETRVLPKVLPQNKELYKAVYGELIGTVYEGKSPDFKAGEHFYEHEGYTSPKNALRNMLTRGLKQSDRLVIESEGSDINYIKKSIKRRVVSGVRATEVWVRNKNGTLVNVYNSESPTK